MLTFTLVKYIVYAKVGIFSFVVLEAVIRTTMLINEYYKINNLSFFVLGGIFRSM